MRAIIKREFKNYLKNPILWIGVIFLMFELYQILNPYLQIHYFQSEQEIEGLKAENMADADIMEGYVKSTEEERMEYMCKKTQKEMASELGITEEEAGRILDEMCQKDMTVDEMEEYLWDHYDFFAKYGMKYYYQISEFHKGDMEEANAYIKKNLETHTFSYYFGRKFADFCGLYMGFFSALMLAFLFIRDTRRDMYELLHTKPVSAAGYIGGKIGGGFLTMAFVWGILTTVFGILCEFYGRRQGFPLNLAEFAGMAAAYILPNILMITCIYTITALIFKNPLPAVPCIFLYIIYSNMGSIGPDGDYGYYGRPLAIMVRFPGNFFETTPPPLAVLNQIFLICASIVLVLLAVRIWKRRRVY